MASDLNKKVEQAVKDRLARTDRQLRAQAWFKRGAWLTSLHAVAPATSENPEKPDGYTLQVFKKHWFNDDHQGIHVESYLALDLAKQKKSYVTFHILHGATIPGTELPREKLAQPFIDKIYDEVKAWDGYEFCAGKYGTHPFSKFLDATADGFEKVLAGEIGKICVRLGPLMDQTLKSVLATKNQ